MFINLATVLKNVSEVIENLLVNLLEKVSESICNPNTQCPRALATLLEVPQWTLATVKSKYISQELLIHPDLGPEGITRRYWTFPETFPDGCCIGNQEPKMYIKKFRKATDSFFISLRGSSTNALSNHTTCCSPSQFRETCQAHFFDPCRLAYLAYTSND